VHSSLLDDAPPSLPSRIVFDPSRPSIRIRLFVQTSAVLLIVLGVTVLLGWALRVMPVLSLSPNFATMKPNTALSFTFFGLTLWLIATDRARFLRAGLTMVVLTIALLTIAEYGAGASFGLDELLFREDTPVASVPGRMSGATAAAFCLLGFTGLPIRRWYWARASAAAAFVAAAIAGLSLIGYLFGAGELYSVPAFGSIALHTALGLLVASAAALLTNSAAQPTIALLTSETPASRVFARFLPAIVAIPLVVGWLRLQGQKSGYHDTPFGVAMQVISTIALLGGIAVIGARRLVRLELIEQDARLALTVRDRELTVALEQFRRAIEAAPAGMILVDDAGRIAMVNAQTESLFGYRRAQLVGQPIEMLIPARHAAVHVGHRDHFLQQPQPRPMGARRELFALRRDGTEVAVEIGLNPIETPEGRFVLSVVVDVTERRRADEDRNRLVNSLQALTKDLESRVEAGTREARASEARYRAIFNDSPISLWEADFSRVREFLFALPVSDPRHIPAYLLQHPEAVTQAAGGIRLLAMNRRSLELFEAEDEAQFRKWLTAGVGGGDPYFRDLLIGLLSNPTPFEIEIVRRTMKGSERDISLRVSIPPEYEGSWSRIVWSMVDVTATKVAEARLRAAVQHQEVLLKEIHHRVKNNLAVISSLFYLESRHAGSAAATAVFEESRRRVRSMALVHETLYGSKNLSEIDLGEYTRILVTELISTYRVTGQNVQLALNLETMSVDVDLAVPCGLILNELISNGLKHGFPNGRSGQLQITMRRIDADVCEVRVIDDGVGLSERAVSETSSTLGLRLIRSLAKQIRGSFELVPHQPGTEARLTFPIERTP
jgi:PAS domain S-box-containing protein